MARGWQRRAVDRRLLELSRAGRTLDVGRVAVLRDLADAVDHERGRLAESPDTSSGTLGRLLARLGVLWDAWDPQGEDGQRDPWDELAAHLQAVVRHGSHTGQAD